jgi:hypothetical protein
MPTITVSHEEARGKGALDDESILAAIALSREEEAERLDP